MNILSILIGILLGIGLRSVLKFSGYQQKSQENSMVILTNPLQCRETKINVETRLGTIIPNRQPLEFTQPERNWFQFYENNFPDVQLRTEPIPFYNCHGLVFASRRTWIEDAIMEILEDDGYAEIAESGAIAGDIIVYFDIDGEPNHSGIFLGWSQDHPRRPRVLSKWGKYREVIHLDNYCPYEFSATRYYRVTHGADAIIKRGRSDVAVSSSQYPQVSVQAPPAGIIYPGS